MNEDGRRDIALRIKAALWLSGRRGTAGTKEDPVVAMTTAELAEHDLLVQNDITRSKLDEVLRLRRDAKPMELQVIAQALGLPAAFFSDGRVDGAGAGDEQQDLAQALETIRVLADRLQLDRLAK